MTVLKVPETGRSVTATVTDATHPHPQPSPWPGPYPPSPPRHEYDVYALLAELVVRLEHDGRLPKNQPLPDPVGARRAVEDLLRALGVTPVDRGMGSRIMRRLDYQAGVR